MQAIAESTKKDMVTGNLDTSFLKILALLFMIVDHLGASIFPGIQEFRVIGRMAFPLYAWCLVVGSVKTRNVFRYGLRLLLLGIIAQPLYMMALSHTWTDLNILFSLLIGLVAIYGIQRRAFLSQFWAPALCYLLLGYLKVDYGWRGLTFMLVLYGARQTRGGLIAAYMAYAFFWGTGSAQVAQLFGLPLSFLSWPGVGVPLSNLFHMQSMIWLSLPLVVFSTRTGIRMPQWLGYALYPMHFVLIILLRLLVGGASFAALTQRF